jgi:hypothetical protein
VWLLPDEPENGLTGGFRGALSGLTHGPHRGCRAAEATSPGLGRTLAAA